MLSIHKQAVVAIAVREKHCNISTAGLKSLHTENTNKESLQESNLHCLAYLIR